MNMRKHLIWDWNGTLFDDFPATVASTNHAISTHGAPALSVYEHRTRFYRPIIDFYSELIGKQLTQDEFTELDLLFHEYYAQQLDQCPLTADAVEAIGAWAGTQSLLSMWMHESLVPLVTARGLFDKFARIDGLRNGSINSKHPHLLAHMQKQGIEASDCVLIGDSLDDALSAKRAGAACVLYMGGVTPPREFSELGFPLADTLTDAVALAQTS